MADRPTCSSRTATRARLCPALTWSSTWTACWQPRRAGRGVAVAPVQVLHDQQQRRAQASRWTTPSSRSTATPARHPRPQHPRPPGRSRPDRAAAGPAPPGPDPRPHPTPPRPAGRPGRAALGDRYERQAVLVERHVAAAHSTRTLCRLAMAASRSASQVLPTPASPPITATSGVPSAAWARSWRSRASSWVRPTRRPVEPGRP
jgi:hypothetical protein